MTPRDELLRLIVTAAAGVSSPNVESFCAKLEKLASPVTQQELNALVGTAVQPEARAAYSLLLKVWQRNLTDLSPQALAWALRAASATDNHHRTRQSLEMVWSGPHADATAYRRTDQVLLELIKGAKTSIIIATFAAYKIPKIAAALVKAAERGVSVILILESAEESEGRLTFSASRAMGAALQKSAAIYVWPLANRGIDPSGQRGALHVKCALADDNAALVSSANLTESAMTLNMELGLLVKGGELPRALTLHMRSLISSGLLMQATESGGGAER